MWSKVQMESRPSSMPRSTCFSVLIPLLMLMPVSPEIRMVLFIVEACPAGAVTSMFAQIFGGDYQYATGIVVGSTLLSMATMPLVLALALAVL